MLYDNHHVGSSFPVWRLSLRKTLPVPTRRRFATKDDLPWDAPPWQGERNAGTGGRPSQACSLPRMRASWTSSGPTKSGSITLEEDNMENIESGKEWAGKLATKQATSRNLLDVRTRWGEPAGDF